MTNLGVKALNLLRLRDEFGFAVPEFVAIPFDELIADFPSVSGALSQAIDGYLRGATDLSEVESAVKKILAGLRVREAWLSDSWSSLEAKPWKRVSYRTSAAMEDEIGNSFAGQYETYLDQELSREVFERLALSCFASLVSPRVIGYLKAQGVESFSVAGSLVVQEMFFGERAGVLFTENGQGSLSVAFVDGWQNTVVEGSSANEILVPRHELVSTKLPSAMRELCEKALAIEARIGVPIDVEWAYRGSDLVFLQFRPQTVASIEYLLEWDSTNISENYPGITLPLTYSYIRQLYAGVYPAFFRLLGTKQSLLDANSAAFDNMLGYLNGRVYYRISNWYTVLQLLPGRSNQEFFEAMLNPVKKRGTDASKRRLDLRSVLAIGRFVGLLLRSERLSRKFRDSLVPNLAVLGSYKLEFISAAKILDALKRGRVEMLNRWAVPILNDVKLMVYHGALKRMFKNAEPVDYLRFLHGLSDRASIKPLEGLSELGKTLVSAKASAGVTSIGDLKATPLWPQVVAAANRYVVEFGARTPDELKLENQRLTETLDSVLELAEKASSATLRAPRSEKTEWPSAIPAWERPMLRYLAENTRRAIDWRERFRFNRAQFFNVARDAFDAIGEALVAEGSIAERRDIYWLTEQEVDELVNGHAWSLDAKARVAERKAEFERYQEQDMPLAVAGWGRIAPHHLSPTKPTDESLGSRGLAGNGVAPGTLTAPVVVAKSFDPNLDVRGKILVVHHIDPGWTLLFTQAAGIVAERGNALSHAAIIAREIGIPAVVAAVGATSELSTGQIVSIDGVTGSIVIEQD